MAKKLFVKIFLLAFMILSAGCAGKLPDNNKLNIDVDSIKVVVWINMMPGSRPSFHLSGELKIQNLGSQVLDGITIQQCIISRDTTEVLKFKPVFSKKNQGGNNLNPGETGSFSLASPDNVDFTKLNNLNSANILFELSSGGKYFEFKIDNVKIDRVY